MPEAFYLPSGPDRFRATELTQGPWEVGLQHAGPPAALLGRAVEGHSDRAGLQVARVTFEILRAVPIAELEVTTRPLRGGRSVELVEASLLAAGAEVMRATALRVRTADLDLPTTWFRGGGCPGRRPGGSCRSSRPARTSATTRPWSSAS